MLKIHLLLHNIRSTHNVGSLIRTADGLAATEVICSGYTPYPKLDNDQRLPHITTKLSQAIHKTALGAENSVAISYQPDPAQVIKKYKQANWQIICLEQANDSQELANFKLQNNCLLVLGEEVAGIEQELLDLADITLEIPLYGTKESLNVSVAGAIALYQLRQVV